MMPIEKIESMLSNGEATLRIPKDLMIDAFPPVEEKANFDLFKMRKFFDQHGYKLEPENAEGSFDKSWFTVVKVTH